MNKLPKRKFGALLSLAATTGLFAVNGNAQTTATNQTPQVLDKFVVTGSYLPPAATAIANPLTTVDTTTIENSGNNTSVLEILRKTVPQFSGNGNIGSGNANISSGSTQGGSMLSLRNTSTLVLVNGRRMAYAPVDAQGGFQFVDVNLIPVAAIERIEVLKDGASAIYGTDAVGGVVNIILKTNYEGFEAGGRYGWSTNQGHQAERSAYVVGGVGNDKTHFTVSAEWIKQDPIMAYERPYSAVTYGTPTFAGSVNIGGQFYLLDPSKNAPPVTPGGLPAATLVANGTYKAETLDQIFQVFNLSQYVTQTVENQRKSFTFAADHKIADFLTGFGDVMVSQTNTYSQINGQPINSSALAAFPADPNVPGYGGTKIPAGLYGNPFNVPVTARNRLVTHPREYLNDTTNIRGVAGLRGDIGTDWHWEAAATYNRITQDYANPGVINNKALAYAIVSGQFNFFARNQAPGVLENTGIVGTATGGFISTLKNLDFTINGHAFQLPAGSLDVAFRAEQRREGLSGTADPNSQLDPVTGQLGWNGATTLYPFDANRSVGALMAEVRIPILKDVVGAHLLDVDAAVRHEYYSDTSNPTVPKVTARWLPFNDEFAFRGTYGKSFSAPQLYSLFGPVSVGYTDAFDLTSSDGKTTIHDFQTNIESGSNPQLKPSKSENYTLGFTYSPKAVKGLKVDVDYWHIRQTELVSSIPAPTILQDVENKGAASAYVNQVRFGSFTGSTATKAGMISAGTPDDIYVISTLINIAKQELSGWDVAANYTYNNEGIGRFDFGTNIGIYNHYSHTDLPGDPAVDTVGKSTDFNGTIPRWQSYTTVDFKRDNYGASLGWRSIPAVTDADDGTHVGSFNTLDGTVSYTFGANMNKYYLSGAKVTLGCNNIFNRFGPLDPTIFSDANVDISTYGAMGRFVYVDLKVRF